MASLLWTLATLGAALVPPANAGRPQDSGEYIGQKPLLQMDCLPGPLTHDAYLPSCLSMTSNANRTTPSSPWTHAPYCAGASHYCVHTSNDLYGPDRGVSIIDGGTSKDEKSPAVLAAERIAAADAATLTVRKEPAPPPWEVRNIPGKGKGMVATRKILRGQVFMVDRAAVVADMNFPQRMESADGRAMLHEAFHRHPAAEQLLTLARSSLDPENVPAPEDIMRTNSFTLEIGGKSYMILFPRIARINHACRPSALTRFNETDFSNTVTAFHDILPGEEISISYSSFGLTSEQRQKTLLSKWGFDCTCSLCTSPPAELTASDARRTKIQQLGGKAIKLVEQGTSSNDKEVAKKKLRRAAEVYAELVETVEEEALVPHMGDHYEALGRLVAVAGDLEKGKEWLRRGKQEREEYEKAGKEDEL
ncbi:hypothetical protein VTJ83DRAFT_6948 [Remersonia thermophila]|uniref:SET domain-containing protein n=1 Tax=Remersonia thermophila TaxID=72144 RepID=A0ABR4D655_9PEZI